MSSFGQTTYLETKNNNMCCIAANLLKEQVPVFYSSLYFVLPNQLAYWGIDQVAVGFLTLLAVMIFIFCAMF